MINSQSGKAGWKSPSNIALVKYWGKKGKQIPANPSLSFTLKNCVTETHCRYQYDKGLKGPQLSYSFNSKHNTSVEDKILSYFQSLVPEMPFLANCRFEVDSHNNFPHAAGIASSASSMSALSLCLVSIEEAVTGICHPEYEFKKRASYLARLGSGSACRSVFGGFSLWGQSFVEGSSDQFAIPLEIKSGNIFNHLQDTILVVDEGEKQVSSRAGHGLMNGHPFAGQRFIQANENLQEIIKALEEEDIDKFIGIVESEALALHAMMMTSKPSFILMKPGTIEIINKIRQFRKESGIPVCFTLDAGPNVHLIYPYQRKSEVNDFVVSELLVNCARNYYINDETGQGPEKLISL